MSVNDLMTALIDELADGDVLEALAQPLTVAALWDDLARLNGEELPRWVAAVLDDGGRGPRPLPLVRTATRYEEVR